MLRKTNVGLSREKSIQKLHIDTYEQHVYSFLYRYRSYEHRKSAFRVRVLVEIEKGGTGI